ncbi:Ig-like domain-containing protein [Hymenobacter cellulosivorans]|uniref:Ig-like domain-containing protein n=1 Tax=Hymenobacter cellulosivorans TaxID=2932249 RepID=A0ABY4FAY9_9BACT|nr:Ig-like domain-containing protein [Hymenobacter cellulosivorans]UOQ53600.1 Ig-like domain-containing protein [Hymenobacter cellulosivorans]
MTQSLPPNPKRRLPQLALLLIWLLSLMPRSGHAQLYYLMNDGVATSTLDELRRSPLSAVSETILSSGFVASPGTLAIDAANNRIFVADVRNNQPKIVAISLTAPYTVSTFLTPAAIAGSASTALGGIAVDNTNGFLYYTVNDGAATTTLDELRRSPLSAASETVLSSGFVASPGTLAIDAANNRIFVADVRNNQPKIVAISLAAPYTVSTFLTPAAIAGSSSTALGGIAVDNTNGFLYYTTTEGAATSTMDELRRSPLSAASETILRSGFVASPGMLAIDAANNRIFVADVRNNQPKIVAISLAAPYTASTFLTPAAINGSANTALAGIVVFPAAVLPTVTTAAATSIASTSAVLGGSVTADGGATITARGVVYSTTNTAPTIGGTGVTQDANPATTATFSETISGLTPGTVYYVRAYATNSAGTSYGSVVSFTTPPNAPVVLVLANGSLVNNTTPTYEGTALVNSTVTVIVDGTAIGTTTTNSAGNWALTQPTALAQGSHTVRATASISGSAQSASSNTNTFIIDSVRPTVVISSSAGASGSTTGTSPIPFNVTFSESVTGFVAGDVTVTNGTISSFAGSGASYSFTVTPAAGGAITVNVPANVAQDAAGNFNTTATQFSITYTPPTATVVSVTRLMPSPTATTQVRYRVVFSGSVTGISTTNFSVTTTGSVSGATVSSVSGSGTTYTVTVNTGSGDGTLRLNVDNSTGISPTVTGLPYTSGETYTITKSFAATPQLTIQGTGGTGSDVTAFVDVVQVLNGGSAFANALQNPSFEQHDPLANGDFGYQPTGASWTFNAQAGIAEAGSAFTPVTPVPNGIAVAFVQSNGGNNGQLQQNLAVPTGSNYQVRFQTAQRICCTTLDQSLNVFLNGVFLGNIQPNSNAYSTFTSPTFSVTAPALTATVSTTSASPTGTSPIPFSVSFSQSVGTTFTASDVTVSGGTLTSGSFSGSNAGPYTFTVTPGASGTVSVSLAANVAQDANNTTNSASNTVSVQYAQPVTAAPVVTTPANGALLNTSTPTYTGTAPANSTVAVYVDTNPIGTTTANASGNWTLTQPTALTQGSHTVNATAQTSGATVSVRSNTNNFTIDAVRPTVVISSTAGASGTTTSTSPLPFTVTFSETVTGFVAGDVTVTNGTISGFSGSGTTYSFNVTPPGSGTVTVNVPANVAQDAASNFNTAATQFTFNYSQPVTPAPVVIEPANGSLVNNNRPVYGGTAVAGSTVTVYVDGTAVGTATTANDGRFNLIQPTALAQGSHTVYARAQLSGLAVSVNSNTNTFTVDTLPPTVLVSAPGTTDGSTTTTSPIFFSVAFFEAVTGFTAADVVVTNGTVSNFVGSGSNYSFNVTPTANGAVTVTVPANSAQDAAGNGNIASSPYTVIYNQSVTATPVVTAPANGSLLSTTTPTYVGTAVTNSTVTVYVDGTSIGTTTANASGNWTFTQASALAQGSHTVYATAQLSGQAVSANSNTNTFTVDSVRPTVVISSTASNPTSTSPIPVTVTFSESVIGFVAGDVTVTNGTLANFSGSGASYSFTITPASSGSVTANIAAGVAQDAAGNPNAAAPQFLIIYSQPVTAAPVVTLPANGSLTNTATPTYGGTAAVNSIVTVYVDGSSVGTTTANNLGNWAIAQPTALAQGSHTVYATAQLSGSAVSANSSTNTFTVDSVRPTVAIGSSASNPTSISSIPFLVTFSEAVTGFVAGDVTVTNGTISSFTGSGTTYAFNVTPAAAGNVTVTVPANVAVDAAGNGNTGATQFSIQYAPIGAPTVATAAASSITTTSAVLGGNVTADGGATVTERGVVYSSTTTAPTTADTKAVSGSGTGVFSTPVSGLTPGATYYVRAYAINSAGTSYGNLTSFIATPAAPRVTVPSNGSVATTTTPTYFGVSQAGSTVTVYVDGTSIGTTFTNGGGIFSLTQPTPLAQGSHTVYATAQLSGSAVSANSTTNTFTVDSGQPTVAISSTASNPTSTSPIPVTVTFSESVTGFVAGDVTVTGGTLSAFTGSGASYSFNVTPTSNGTVTVDVPANVAQDGAGNGNTAATQFTIQYNAVVTATTWTGAVSTDWFTAGNWTAGVPTSTVDAFINGGVSRYPVVASGTAAVKNLVLATNASLTQSGGILAVNGAGFAIDGTFTATGGVVNLNGTSEQRIGGTRTAFYDLTVGTAGARLDGPLDIQRVLTLNGNLSTITQTLTLLSNSAGTAMVVNNNGAAVLGTAAVQRYIDPSLNPGLGYRHYSSPVQSTSVADLATSGFSPVVNPAYNTQGNTVNPFPTVYGYNEARIVGTDATTQNFEYGYFSPNSLGETLTRGRGYTVNIAASEKVDLVGTLNTGDVTVGALGRGGQDASGWHLLGNPYPAPLDWNKARTNLPAGMIDAIYVYKSATQYGGTYQFYQNGFGTLPNGIVGSMQGFFVRVSQPVAAFSFLNAWRSTSYETPTFNRPTADNRPALQLDLVSGQGAHDPAYVYFEQGATAGLDDHYDAEKLPNTTGLNLASVAAGKGLAVNGLPFLQATTIVPLTVGVPVTGTYTLQAASLANFGSTPVYLLDAVTGQQVDLKQQGSYSFSASNAALITGRFSLSFGSLRPLATNGGTLAASIALYPNPAQKMAWVELPASLGRKPVQATLLDALGRVVRTQQLPANGDKAHALSLDELPVGVYSLRLSTEAGLVTKRLIIE